MKKLEGRVNFWNCLDFLGHHHFWCRLHFCGHLHFFGPLHFWGCLWFWGRLWFKVVFIFEVLFVFEVIFILEVIFIFKVVFILDEKTKFAFYGIKKPTWSTWDKNFECGRTTVRSQNINQLDVLKKRPEIPCTLTHIHVILESGEHVLEWE